MPRNNALHLLRGVAAVMVLVAHSLSETAARFGMHVPEIALAGTRGVDLFFVLSGFLVTGAALRMSDRPGSFFHRRAARVVPLYAVFTTLMVAVLLLAPGALKETSLDWGQIWGSYAFWPVARADGRIAPVLSVGWSLNYEMAFYAMLALSLAATRGIKTAMGLLVCLPLLGAMVPGASTWWQFYSNPIVLEFVLGGALYGLVSKRALPVPLNSWRGGLACAGGVVGLGALVALAPVEAPRWITGGLPAALMVACCACLRVPQVPALMRLGDVSYALYLSHRFVLRPVSLLCAAAGSGAGWAALCFVLCCVLSIVVAGRVYDRLDLPLHRWALSLRWPRNRVPSL